MAILTIFFAIIFIVLVPYQTSSITQRYGISPRLFPYVLGFIVLISGLIILIDSFINKVPYKDQKIKIFSKNENLRLLYYIGIISFLPILMNFLGFFVGIIIVLLFLLLFSGAKNKITILGTIVFTIIFIYYLFSLLRIYLPESLLF